MDISEGSRGVPETQVLIVDDEQDIIDILNDMLNICVIESALNFEDARKLLNERKYDIAILDIMGVNGYVLLGIAQQNDIPVMMLTAHALTPDDFAKSISQGAAAYIPKEKISEIKTYLIDLLKSHSGAERPYKWFSRLESFFDKLFGVNQTYKEVKEEYINKYGPIDED